LENLKNKELHAILKLLHYFGEAKQHACLNKRCNCQFRL